MALSRRRRRDPAHTSQTRGTKKPRRRAGLLVGGASYPQGLLVHAGPGLAAAEHAAKGATLDAQCIGALHSNRRIIGRAGVRIEDAATPFLILAGLHIDQNLLAVPVRFRVHGIAAEIGAALLDPDLAFLLCRQPDAER